MSQTNYWAITYQHPFIGQWKGYRFPTREAYQFFIRGWTAHRETSGANYATLILQPVEIQNALDYERRGNMGNEEHIKAHEQMLVFAHGGTP